VSNSGTWGSWGCDDGAFEDDSAFGAIITSAVYLPRIQLFGGNSDLVKEGKIGMGHYGLVRAKDQVDDLGVQFNCCPFSWRFKAVRITEANDVFSYFNPNADEFKAIMVESEQQDSGCMYGVEFLTWIPDPTATFATFFFASKTARRESPNLKQILTNRGAATCKGSGEERNKPASEQVAVLHARRLSA
jgi:hypothetical protein